MNRRARLHDGTAPERGDFLSAAGRERSRRRQPPQARRSLPVLSDCVPPCSERIVDVDIADPYLRYQPAKTV